MHRAKTINEVAHLLQLQLIEAVPLHGLQDLAGAMMIDVGVVKARREHDDVILSSPSIKKRHPCKTFTNLSAFNTSMSKSLMTLILAFILNASTFKKTCAGSIASPSKCVLMLAKRS